MSHVRNGAANGMRSAPFGFFLRSWKFAYECAEITHGHREAAVAAAVFADAIARVLAGQDLASALADAASQAGAEGTSRELVVHALDLVEMGRPAPECIQELVAGWVADEALAISVYCAVAADSFDQAVCWAVNHSGVRTPPVRLRGTSTAPRKGWIPSRLVGCPTSS
ncbi:MAG: ADP-ribosylglycohydrolase family protein [Fimbriimonadia bacterium]